jgi:hypothetical protein
LESIKAYGIGVYMEGGLKLDNDKPNLDLVLGGFSKALIEVGKVGTFGATKYAPDNWKLVDNGKERYSSAMLRHYFEDRLGNIYDEESGLLHLAHAAWNSLVVLSFEIERLSGD